MKFFYSILLAIFMTATTATVVTAQISQTEDIFASTVATKSLPKGQVDFFLFSDCAVDWNINGGIKTLSKREGLHFTMGSGNYKNFCPFVGRGQVIVIWISKGKKLISRKAYGANSKVEDSFLLNDGYFFMAHLRERKITDIVEP